MRRQKKSVGNIAALNYGKNKIYYLISNRKFWEKPTYDSLRRSLLSLRDDMIGSRMCKIGIPRLGCGLDGLEWPRVRDMIESVFSETSIEVVVCIK